MRKTFLKHISKTEKTVNRFGGYNAGAGIAYNEFRDMKNLSGDDFPLLSTRKKRGVCASGTSVRGMINKDALCYVDDGTLYINRYPVAGLSLSDTDKQLVSMGAYLLIFPDKKWINTKDLSDIGDIDAEFTSSSAVTYTLCRQDASAYGVPTVSAAEPQSPENGDLWIDTSDTPHVLKQYSSSSAVWVGITATYIKISAAGIAEKLCAGDAVTISGSVADINGDGVYIEAALHTQTGEGDYLVVAGILDETASQNTAITVSRRMPAADFVIENNNRLWACRYGTDNSGEVVNEIYASKLGDFKNWNCFRGLSTDSYAASLGSDGPFTAAFSFKGHPTFWKEECFHKIYGDLPANFQINSTRCDGVQKGCGGSLAVVDSALFYKSASGIFCYDGSLPVKISDALEGGYTDAVGGGLGMKYYVSMKKDGAYSLFVYDSGRGLWHREDETKARAFCAAGGELYMTVGNDIIAVNGGTESEAIPWYFESGLLGVDSPDRKYPSAVVLRLHLSGTAKAYIEYDGSGTWTEAADISGDQLTYDLTLRIKRCDCFRLKVSGSGEFKLYSLTVTTVDGSRKV